MLHLIISFLKKESKRGDLSYNSTKTGFFLFILVFTLLAFFKPFGLEKLIIKAQLVLIIGFSLCSYIGYTISRSICRPYREQKWYNYHEFLFQIACYLFIWQLSYCYYFLCIEYLFNNYIVITDIINTPTNFYRKIGLYTFQIGIFVSIVLTLCNKLFYYEKNYSKILKTRANNLTIHTNKIFSIIGKNKNEHLTLDLNQFICAKSDDHYIKVYYQCPKSHQVKSSILRNTMKALELQGIEFPNIYRCHKSYIVNLLLLKSVIGNSSKAHAYIDFYPEKIPISKNKISFLKDYLLEIKKKS